MKSKVIMSALVLCLYAFGGALAEEGFQTITDPVKVFEQGYLQVVGYSEEGQSRYRALRSAQVVAQRDLLEAMQGLHLFGNTSVRDGMLESDEIKTTVEGYLRGAMKCGQEYNSSKGFAEVCVRVYIRGKGGLYDIILPLMKDDRLMPEKKPAFKPSMPDLKPEVMTPGASQQTETDDSGRTGLQAPSNVAVAQQDMTKPEVKAPSELTHPHDGLIIDARDFQFRPALVNRVLTDKDEVVFEPSKIQSDVLVERGCGGFTTDDGKAKALLESWGSKNPMIVRCKDVQKLTDAKISQDDAAAVYVNDQKSNLLAKARVVFILK